jgi:ABC-2 type transport system permease protein
MIAHALTPPVRALIRKELREFRHHRMIFFSAIILPVAFLVLPVINLMVVDPAKLPGGVNIAVGQAMFCFFLTPCILPATTAAYAVIGERDQGTLEPLLTLPLTNAQFLAGKVLAIVVPTTLISWSIYLLYLAVIAIGAHGAIRPAALDIQWPIGVLGMALPLALFSTLVGVSASARAKDVRVAEHLSGLVLLPAMLPVLLIVTRAVPVTLVTWAIFFSVVAGLDVLLLAFALRIFERERALSNA